MKNNILLLTVLLFSFFMPARQSGAIAQLQTPALSPAGVLKQTVGLTDIKVTYSRPSVKGRVIFGNDGLLPFGEFWRLGANDATKFSFSTDVELAGNILIKGDYTMLVKPNISNWDFSVYSYNSTDWNEYVSQAPVLKFSIPIQKDVELKESFEISVQDITSESANLEFSWERLLVKVPVTVTTMETVMTNIENTMKGPSLNDYFQAALFMHENKQDLPRALEYIQNVTKTDKALFFVVYREALILKDLNRQSEALQAAQRSLKLSKEAGNKDFVRFNEQLIAVLR